MIDSISVVAFPHWTQHSASYKFSVSGRSIFLCQAISRCSLVETTFLLLVTVSTVGSFLTTIKSKHVKNWGERFGFLPDNLTHITPGISFTPKMIKRESLECNLLLPSSCWTERSDPSLTLLALVGPRKTYQEISVNFQFPNFLAETLQKYSEFLKRKLSWQGRLANLSMTLFNLQEYLKLKILN